VRFGTPVLAARRGELRFRRRLGALLAGKQRPSLSGARFVGCGLGFFPLSGLNNSVPASCGGPCWFSYPMGLREVQRAGVGGWWFSLCSPLNSFPAHGGGLLLFIWGMGAPSVRYAAAGLTLGGRKIFLRLIVWPRGILRRFPPPVGPGRGGKPPLRRTKWQPCGRLIETLPQGGKPEGWRHHLF